MNSDSDPLDYLIESCEKAVGSGYWTLTKFNILNAKDELRRLREKKNSNYENIAWASIGNKGGLYNLTLHYNMFANEDALLPLYCNKQEFEEKYGKLSK